MMILLYIALGYLLFTGGILYMNKRDFHPLQPVPRNYFDEQAAEVAICIPARNEERTIERCVRSALDQQYPNHRVYVLDDDSTDGTTQILDNLKSEFSDKLTIMQGKPKPQNWMGKSWACHQLSNAAEGDIYLFVDADTWLEPEAVAKTVRAMARDVVDFITVWPMQKFGTFWERTVIPLVYFALLTLLPVRYVYRAPKWVPPLFRKEAGALFAAACGQFMAFKKTVYKEIGGHASVKNEIVEDVELAKNIKSAGYRMNMYHGRKTVNCRMYSNAGELWEGFRKNFLAGFSNNVFLFGLMGVLHIITFILPALAIPFLFIAGNYFYFALFSGLAILMLVQRFAIDSWFNWNPLYGLLQPLGVAWFQFLGMQVLNDHFKDEAKVWKGREIPK